MTTPEFRIELLAKHHRREDFHCGVATLDHYLRTTARQHQRRHISRIFVLVTNDAPERIRGYYSLSVTEITVDSIPAGLRRKLPRHGLPAARLGRLAVDRQNRGKSIGRLLLIDAMRRTYKIALDAGLVALVVDAKDNEARRFYERHGFQPLEEHPLTLLMMTDTLTDLFTDNLS